MTQALGLRTVDHADGAFESLFQQCVPGRALAQPEMEPVHSRVMKQPLVAARQRWANALPLSGVIPVRCGRDSARMCGEADRMRLGTIRLLNELAQIEFSSDAHLGGARV